jgi:hypothetical protein
MSIQDFQKMHEQRVRVAAEMQRCRDLVSSTVTEYANLRAGFEQAVNDLPESTKEEYGQYCVMFGQDLTQWSQIGDPLTTGGI